MTHSDNSLGSGTSYVTAVNRSINVSGTVFAYRDLGPRSGVPLILLNHWGAVLDNFDPRIIDGLASKHRVIATDYRGLGQWSPSREGLLDATEGAQNGSGQGTHAKCLLATVAAEQRWRCKDEQGRLCGEVPSPLPLH
jgi:pimeloyl-ACP methyl ester carboxylesterase